MKKGSDFPPGVIGHQSQPVTRRWTTSLLRGERDFRNFRRRVVDDHRDRTPTATSRRLRSIASQCLLACPPVACLVPLLLMSVCFDSIRYFPRLVFTLELSQNSPFRKTHRHHHHHRSRHRLHRDPRKEWKSLKHRRLLMTPLQQTPPRRAVSV